MASEWKVKTYVTGHNPQKAHLHPLYGNNPANAFPRYHPETELTIRHQLKLILASK